MSDLEFLRKDEEVGALYLFRTRSAFTGQLSMTARPAVPLSAKSPSQSGQRLPTTGAMSTTRSA
jgi:hypothetical protein